MSDGEWRQREESQMIPRFLALRPGRCWVHPRGEDMEEGQVWEDVGACWVCSASRTSGEMVRDGRALGSELRGGMGKAAVAHRPHNQDGLTVRAEAASC